MSQYMLNSDSNIQISKKRGVNVDATLKYIKHYCSQLIYSVSDSSHILSKFTLEQKRDRFSEHSHIKTNSKSVPTKELKFDND